MSDILIPRNAGEFADMTDEEIQAFEAMENVPTQVARGEGVEAVPQGTGSVVDAVEAPTAPEEEEEPKGSKAQSSRLVAFVQGRAALLRDGNRDVYALDNATRAVRKIGSGGFRDWLTAGFFGEFREAARGQAIAEACSVLSGLGRESGTETEVHVRSAVLDGAYYLDLGEEGQGRAIRVSPGSWAVVEASPVHFIRSASMRPIAPPVQGGSLDPLWEIANIPEESRVLVVAWLCECLRPETAFPVLELTGEEGSAKTSTQKALRTLIDPNASLVDAPPKSEEDLLLSAADALVCSIENVSHLSLGMQDAYCRLATGAGLKKRKLYSDSDVVTLTFKRPVVLNGITEAVTASDLVNRTVTIDLPRLTGGHKEETGLQSAFESALAGIRGALLDIFADALRRLPGVVLPSCEDTRLVSFMSLGVAVAEAMGKDAQAFLGPYLEGRDEAGARILEGSPVGEAVLTWISNNPQGGTFTPKEWADRLKPESGLSDGAWPKSPRGLASVFKRLAPALRRQGVECRSEASLGGPKNRSGNRWKIAPT